METSKINKIIKQKNGKYRIQFQGVLNDNNEDITRILKDIERVLQ